MKSYSISIDGQIKTFYKLNKEQYFKYAECGAGTIFEIETDFGMFRFLSGSDKDDRSTYMILHFAEDDHPVGYYTMEAIDYFDLVHMWINHTYRDNKYCLEFIEHWLYHMINGR